MLPDGEKLDPRARRTRSLILQAFGELLAEKSFEAIAVQEVTDKAQINRATFYKHFTDKYALLDRWIDQMFRQETEKRMLNADHYTLENLRNLILAVCEFLLGLHRDCAQPHPQFEALAETRVKAQIFELLSHWLEQVESPVPIEIPATVAAWAIYGLAFHWSHARKRPALDRFVEEALPFVAVNLESFAR